MTDRYSRLTVTVIVVPHRRFVIYSGFIFIGTCFIFIKKNRAGRGVSDRFRGLMTLWTRTGFINCFIARSSPSAMNRCVIGIRLLFLVTVTIRLTPVILWWTAVGRRRSVLTLPVLCLLTFLIGVKITLELRFGKMIRVVRFRLFRVTFSVRS